jgi:hypothetical protein
MPWWLKFGKKVQRGDLALNINDKRSDGTYFLIFELNAVYYLEENK